MLSHLAAVLSSLGQFEIGTKDLENKWQKIEKQIDELIEDSLELQTIIKELRQAKARGEDIQPLLHEGLHVLGVDPPKEEIEYHTPI